MTRQGLDVEVISLPYHAHNAVKQYRPRLIAVPGFLSRRGYGANSHLEQLRAVPLFNLAIEQIFSDANRKFRMPKDSVAREDVLHLASGDFYQQWLRASGVPKRNIVLIGSLPLQLYRQPYCAYFEIPKIELAKAYGLDSDKPWVLMPENFFAAFFSRSHIRHRLRHGYDKRELDEYVRFATSAFRTIMQWCATAALEADIELIVRPRPAMPTARFVAATRDAIGNIPSKHLHFIKEGDLRSWVLASQLVISSYSTVLIEAAVAGKPALLLTPCEIPRSASSEWHSAAKHVCDVDDFLQRLRTASSAQCDPELSNWADDTLLVHGDAIENLARTLAEIVRGERYVPKIREPSTFTKARDLIGDNLKRGERLVRRLARPRGESRPAHSSDQFDASDVRAVTARWSEVLEDGSKNRAA